MGSTYLDGGVKLRTNDGLSAVVTTDHAAGAVLMVEMEGGFLSKRGCFQLLKHNQFGAVTIGWLAEVYV